MTARARVSIEASIQRASETNRVEFHSRTILYLMECLAREFPRAPCQTTTQENTVSVSAIWNCVVGDCRRFIPHSFSCRKHALAKLGVFAPDLRAGPRPEQSEPPYFASISLSKSHVVAKLASSARSHASRPRSNRASGPNA